MRQIALLGNPGTKRTIYFMEHAAFQAGLHVHFLDWNRWQERLGGMNESISATEDTFLKIDPPLWDSCSLEELNVLTDDYRKKLSAISGLEDTLQLKFLNHPDAISALLNKQGCKSTLSKAGLPVTESIGKQIENSEQLLETMNRRHMFQVFIKPINGSGAAGVAAFRWQPRTGQMVLYTCALQENSTFQLVNTKRLRRFTEKNQILPLLNRILKLGCVVERWYAKAEHNGFSYDLRAVMQDESLDFLLARLSNGPITNLHLNNHPLSAKELHLPSWVMDSITDLCRKATACYPGLRSAGIDILLEKGSLRPRIIEMNGQGDLIYQDIYQDNVIYRHQARMMKEWQDGDNL